MTYPTIMPALTLDFQNSQQLDPRVTFSRTQTTGQATYINSAGQVAYAAEHEARFNHDPVTGECLGLLIEESNNNALSRSTEPDNGYYDLSTGLTKIANNAVSPDGNQTALLLTEDSSTGLHTWGRNSNVSVSNNIMSLFVKSNGATKVGFRQGGESYSNTSFDLSTGTKVSGNGGIEAYPNGWYRIWQIRSGNGNKVRFHLLGDSNELSFQGDGTSGVWVWGFQKEPNKGRPTSLIVTEASTVTRSADVLQITGDNFNSWFNQNKGSLAVDINVPKQNQGRQILSILESQTTSINSFRGIGINQGSIGGSDYVNRMVWWFGGTRHTSGPVVPYAGKFAQSFEAVGTGALAVNGSITYNATNLNKNVTLTGLFANNTFTCKRISFYPEKLTNEQLEAITS